ncbi:D-serine ammonia-lyase [Desulfosediminicola sp.]|uniref:D-serine ammonia-lyase n=1 Tax=Desulfosediminicola sp. TaxID=2886825 RepID=UPI003AF2DE4B
MTVLAGRDLESWCRDFPVLRELIAYRECCWFNPQRTNAQTGLTATGLTAAEQQLAAERLDRFKPFIARVFPETAADQGLIESPLVAIPSMRQALGQRSAITLPAKLLLKCDNLLPISGSVKARGGIYEVLKHAETLAIKNGLLTTTDNYAILAEEHFRTFFNEYKIAVGSTGNLGLSIGIMGAKFGFQVTVHMSADARRWKKDLLKSHGVEVVEYSSDYGAAVTAGRSQAESDPNCHFIDDENSTDLFFGYSVAGQRLAAQLSAMNIEINGQQPLVVYLPCGVGGGPGGITFGLKQVFGDNVHCFFAEPTHSPCMLAGLCTGLHDTISVRDLGLDNITAADGLAVARPSGFIGRILAPLISGVFTVDDHELYRLLALLADLEHIFMEPSALAGLPGIVKITQNRDKLAPSLQEHFDSAVHVAWGTGGSMVPAEEMAGYYRKGKELLEMREE